MKKYLKWIIIAIVIVIVAVTAYILCKKPKEEASLKTINVNEVTRSVFYAPQYVAISEVYFEQEGFDIIKKTYDLHQEQIFEENIVTEHEKMFSEEGIKIKALIAKI